MLTGGTSRTGKEPKWLLPCWDNEPRPAHCLVTRGEGGLVWASARAEPPTHPPTQPFGPWPGLSHPPTHPPTHPTLPPPPQGGGSISSVEQQSRTDQQKFTTISVGTQDLENRVQRYNQLSYQPVLTVMCNKGFTCLMLYEKKVKNV